MSRRPPDGLQIAPLTPAQLGRYKQLRDEALRLHPEAFDADLQAERARPPESYLGRLGLHDTLGGTAITGAWLGDELIGAASLDRHSLPKLRHMAELGSVMVRPEHKGQGVGSALLKACIAQARQAAGLELIVVRVNAASVEAVRLYESAGFQRCGVIPRAVRLTDAMGRPRYFDRLNLALLLQA